MSQEQPPFGLPGPILAEIQRRPRSRIKFSWPPSVDLVFNTRSSTSRGLGTTDVVFKKPNAVVPSSSILGVPAAAAALFGMRSEMFRYDLPPSGSRLS